MRSRWKEIQRKVKDGLRHSFFWRFFSSYIILFLIPFATILFMYNYSSHSIESGILRSNYNILYQFFSNVDAVFSEMDTIARTLTNAPAVQQFALRSDSEMEKASVDAFYLNEYITSFKQKEFENICIYFPEFGRIYNGRNGLALEDFHKTYYQEEAEPEEFEAFLSDSVINYRMQLRSVNHDPLDPLLGVVFSQPASRSFYGAPGITVAITLEQDTLNRILKTSSVQSDGNLMIFSKAGELLAASEPIEGDILSVYDGTKEVYYEDWGGQEYVVQFFPSRVSDCMYASAIPVDTFWDQLHRLQITALVSILLCVLLSCFLAWKMTKVNYSPITGMLSAITETTGTMYDNSGQNEMNFISDVLTHSLNEVVTLTRKMEMQEDTLRNTFLMQAMLGNVADAVLEGDGDVFYNHHITLQSDRFGILYLFVEAVDEVKVGDLREAQNQKILQFILTNVLQELSAQEHQGFVVPIAVNRYALIMNFSRDASAECGQESMQALAETGASFLRGQFGIRITWTLSQVHTDLAGIHRGYLETQEAFRYRFLYGKGGIILYRDIREKQFDFTGMEDEKMEYRLLSYIKEEEKGQSAGELLAEVQSQCGIGKASSLEVVSCYKYDLLIRFSGIIHQLRADRLPESSRLHSSVLAAGTLEEMRACFMTVLDELRQFYQDSQKNYTLCDQVEEYLRENFQNPELSNVMLGVQFHISHSYLSRMFKMQKNTSISDYLYRLRIDHAKKLLEETSDTMETVAVSSGFLSSSTFIKVFKKSEGITPGAYRKLKQSREYKI